MKQPAFYSPDLDAKIRPQDDFYQFANKGWIKAHPIPASQAAWKTFNVLNDEVQHQLQKLMEALAAKKRLADEGTRKLRDYYLQGMDADKLARDGADPLVMELARIDGIEDRAEFPALIARLHNLGVSSFWDYFVGADDKKNTENIIQVYQSGLGMPDRDYYLKDDEASKKARAAYRVAIAKLMRLAGWKPRDAANVADAVFAIETRLAEASSTRVELRDVPAQYNKMNLAKLKKAAPGTDWKVYFKALGVPDAYANSFIVCQPKFMAVAADLLATLPIEQVKAYMSWHLVAASAPYLDDAFVNAHFAFFEKALSGKKEIRPRWKRVLVELDNHVGELLGKQYVDKHFPETSRTMMDALVNDLFATYRARLTALSWMSVPTMAKAVEKLDAMRRKIGFPKKWETYKSFQVQDSYLETHWAAVAFFVRKSMKKLGKPVDRSEWGMTPHTVNAYCSFTFNEIVFPAGILQKPFFDAKWSDALNYGGIGTVIGHELTHAFDDMGSGFDKDGNLKNWWTKADKKKFDAEAKKLADQYSSYVVIGDMRCNGELTLGENIADVGGVAIAYDALERKLGPAMHKKAGTFTPAQQFFIAYAQSEAGSIRPEELRRRLIVDPHAPSYLRVNAALPNLQEFHDAFDIKPGDKLYRAPEERVSIW